MHTIADQNCVHSKFSRQKLSICIFSAWCPTFDGTRTVSQFLIILIIVLMVRKLSIKSDPLCLDYCDRRRSGKDLKTRSQGTVLWKHAALLLPAALGLPCTPPYPTQPMQLQYTLPTLIHTHAHTVHIHMITQSGVV